MTRQTKAFLCAGLTVLAWSTVSTAFKLSLEAMTPMQLIFVSMLTSVLFLGVALFCRSPQKILRELRALTARQRLDALLLGVMLYCYYALLFMAYARLPAQITQPINNTWALMLALLAAWLLRQKLSSREFLFMLVAYAGVVVIATGGDGKLGPLNPFGLVCVIASTLLYALYWIVNTRSGLPQTSGLFLCFLISAALAGLTLAVNGEGLPPASVLPPGIYVGLFELGIPFLLWGLALRLTDSVPRISTLPFLVPFLALFWISLILKEPIAPSTIAGLALIVGGTFMQQRAAARKKS